MVRWPPLTWHTTGTHVPGRYLPVRSRCLHPGQQQGRRRQRRDVHPGIERRGTGDQRLAQVCGQLVCHPTRHSLAAHRTTVPKFKATAKRPEDGLDAPARRPARGVTSVLISPGGGYEADLTA
jgi:hypothetical protein